MCPQRLKPALLSIDYVRAEARTLQEQSFSAACKAQVISQLCGTAKAVPSSRKRIGLQPLPGAWGKIAFREKSAGAKEVAEKLWLLKGTGFSPKFQRHFGQTA